VFAEGTAIASPGADETLRIAWGANGCAEFHDRLIKITGMVGVDKGLGEVVDFATNGGFGGRVVRVPSTDPAQNAFDIAVHNRDGFIVGDAGDGGGGVGADAGKFQERGCRGGYSAGVVGNYGLGGLVEHAGPTVVSKTAPESENILLVGLGKRLDGWEALEEGSVALDDHGYPGLLEHDF